MNEEMNKDIIGERQEEIAVQMAQANNEINYTNIKGKDYAEVKEKVKAFRKVYPEGGISTKIVSFDEEHCVVKAEVFNDVGSLLASGHAQEKMATTKFKDSILEVCETSAIGRALAALGFGIKDSFASAENMQQVADRDEKRDKLLICHRCGRAIIDTQDKNGKVWTAEEISKQTVKIYGDSYCLYCVGEIKKQKTEMEG